jgi:hypothetical protein
MGRSLARILLALCATALVLAAAPGWAAVCGDPDGSGTLTVTDGVQVLRAAAGLSSDCFLQICDVDGNGNVGVTDGVNVLRAAAGLSASTTCNEPVSAFVDDVQTSDGTHAVLEVGVSPIPGKNAPTTVGQPSGDGTATPGGSNTVTVPFNTGSAVSALALASDAMLVFAVADLKGNLFNGFFELPLASLSGEVTLKVSFAPTLSNQSFLLCPATRVNGILSRYAILRQNPVTTGAGPVTVSLRFQDTRD